MINSYLARNTDFLTTVDVVCPKCWARAFIRCDLRAKGRGGRKKNIRFSCPDCGYTVEYSNIPKFMGKAQIRSMHLEAFPLYVNVGCDPYFGFELWYRKETLHGLLWSYNLEHLILIEHHISHLAHGHNDLFKHKDTLQHCLPSWMENVMNREYLLMVIQNLKQK